MEFLSTDIQECSADYLLSETCQDFTEEIRLLMESHDALSNVTCSPNVYRSLNSETSSDSGVMSPYSEDERLCSVINVESLSSTPVFIDDTPTVLPTNQSSCKKEDDRPRWTKISNDIKPLQVENQSDRNRKNAVAARLNRQKKKEYVQGLESRVSSLQSENQQLKRWSSRMEESVSQLQIEVKYLKNVLANQSTLSKLLQNIPQIDEVRLSTSLITAGKRARNTTDMCAMKRVKVDSADEIAGVCLHVVNNTASLEFCSTCSQRSAAATLSV